MGFEGIFEGIKAGLQNMVVGKWGYRILNS